MTLLSELHELIKSTGTMAAIAAIVWLIRRTFTHTIPRIVATFKETIGEQRGDFLEQLESMNIRHDARVETMEQRFVDEIRLQRQETTSKLEKLTDAVKDR